MQSSTKPWYKSKTILFNLGAAIFASLESVSPTLKPLLGDSFWPVFNMIVVIVNAGLRVITTQGITK